ncbi:hypothetical protein [Limnochorda pilosa]|uniref:Uncharacterized protein n=1 Tax=Limnochorda pilosa TaxID=1555112 RepID=A0A0K2SH03_LIMPI|nr:hypothetical protein [Limnochorda pilosa]BAS26396.1 hypothetical protein LIP_0539 [Limnochorda pilosa]
MQRRRRVWVRPVAAILVLALLASSAPMAAARPNLPPVEPISYTLDGSLLPAGSGVTPLSVEELQDVDGEIAPGLVAAARIVAGCIRSAPCRSAAVRIGRTVVKVVRAGFEVVGAGYTAAQVYRDVKEHFGW